MALPTTIPQAIGLGKLWGSDCERSLLYHYIWACYGDLRPPYALPLRLLPRWGNTPAQILELSIQNIIGLYIYTISIQSKS